MRTRLKHLLHCRCVHCRHPLELGGIYFFLNALVSVASWFVAAALYSLYFPAGATALVGIGNSAFTVNYSANFTGTNTTGEPSACACSWTDVVTQCYYATTNAIGVNMHASKIGDLPLFTIVATLAVAWLVAVAGLSLTMKREYLHTFVSLQTGCANAQSHFLDNEGNDAKRIEIFLFNERQWRAIRDRVREWVLSVYATWKALMPSWFTTDLQARIPDHFMPAQVVQELNAQAPSGRRPTLQNMGLLRRVSGVAVATAGESSSLDEGSRNRARTHLMPASSHCSQLPEGLHGGEAVPLDEANETMSSLKPGSGQSSLKPGNCRLGARDMAKLRDTYDLMYTPTIWTARDERNLRLSESAEVSKLDPSPIQCDCPTFGHAAVPVHASVCRSSVRPTASGPLRA